MPKAKFKEQLKKHARVGIKSATFGGEQDGSFEQALSNLAHAYLKDKAPSLLDYEVGFQLLDRNQENTKAVGIFGFKVGSQWLYVPVFFIKGDLKGHELLYIKNQDMFVPLKESWLNYLMNKRPNVLGESVNRNLSEIGVMPPHLHQLSRSPNKFASYSPWVKNVLPALAYIATTNPAKDEKYKDIIDLPTFLKKEGSGVIKSLVHALKENPKLAQALDNLHGLQIIDEAIKEAEARSKVSNSVMTKCKKTPQGVRCVNKPPMQTSSQKSVMQDNTVDVDSSDPIKMAEVGDPIGDASYALQYKLKIYTYDDVARSGNALHELDGKERSKLLNDKVVIKDERDDDETTIAYEVTSPVRLQNPNETGLYDVLVKHNKFEKCLVINGPYCNRGAKNFATIVRLSDGDEDKGRAWINIHPGHIWVGNQYPLSEFREWLEKLPDLESVPSSGLHIILGPRGEATLPLSVDKEISSEDRKIYEVYFKSHPEKERPAHLPHVETRLMFRAYAYDNFGPNQRIILTGKRGTRLRATGEELYIPGGSKILTLRAAKDEDNLFGLCGCDAHSDPSPIEPGNQLDIDLMLGAKTASVKIYDTGTEIEINGKRMQKLAALIHMVRDIGLREDTARTLLKRAAENKSTRFRIKRATQDYPLQKSGPSAPGIPEPPYGYDPMTSGQYPTQNVGEWNMKIPEMSAANTDRMIYHPLDAHSPYDDTNNAPDRQSQQFALQASQTGQKEIFDTAMIGSLLKTVRDDSMVDKYMGDLMKALDRLGRILFLYYWHGDKFEDRYGKGEMTELEDGLRNAFEYLGDIVLFLKQRSMDVEGEQDHGIDLSRVSSDS